VGDLVKISYDEENEEIIDVSTFENISLKNKIKKGSFFIRTSLFFLNPKTKLLL